MISNQIFRIWNIIVVGVLLRGGTGERFFEISGPIVPVADHILPMEWVGLHLGISIEVGRGANVTKVDGVIVDTSTMSFMVFSGPTRSEQNGLVVDGAKRVGFYNPTHSEYANRTSSAIYAMAVAVDGARLGFGGVQVWEDFVRIGGKEDVLHFGVSGGGVDSRSRGGLHFGLRKAGGWVGVSGLPYTSYFPGRGLLNLAGSGNASRWISLGPLENGSFALGVDGKLDTREVVWTDSVGGSVGRQFVWKALGSVSVCGANPRLGEPYETYPLRFWPLFVDTGAICTTVPSEVFDTVLAWAPNISCPNSANSTDFEFLCDVPFGAELPILSISFFNGQIMQLPLSSLILTPQQMQSATDNLEASSTPKLCLLRGSSGAASLQRPDAQGAQIVLGTLALRSLGMVFDTREWRLGFVPSTHTSWPSKCAPRPHCTGEKRYIPSQNKCVLPNCALYPLYMSSNDSCVLNPVPTFLLILLLLLPLTISLFRLFAITATVPVNHTTACAAFGCRDPCPSFLTAPPRQPSIDPQQSIVNQARPRRRITPRAQPPRSNAPLDVLRAVASGWRAHQE